MAFIWDKMAITAGATTIAALQINQLISNTKAELTRRKVVTTSIPEVVISGISKTAALDISKIKDSINTFSKTKIVYTSAEGMAIDKVLVDNIRVLLDTLNSNTTGRGNNDCASSCTGLCSNACAGGCANTCSGSCAGSCSGTCAGTSAGAYNCCSSCGGSEGGN